MFLRSIRHVYNKNNEPGYKVAANDDSPYGRILKDGFMGLNFPPAIEKEYRTARDQTVRKRITSGAFMGIAGIAMWLFLVRVIDPVYYFPSSTFILGFVVIPALLLLALFSQFGYRRRLCSPWIVFIVAMVCVTAILYLQTEMEFFNMPGDRYPYLILLLTMTIIFMTGMMTWRATLVGIIVTFAYSVIHLIVPKHSAFDFIYGLFFLSATVIIGIAGSWRSEHRDREQFLLSRILERMAEHDSLTGLLNHGSFISYCKRAWRQAARECKPVSLLIMDIDHFKKYNDYFGHLEGDTCIVQVARAVKPCASRGLDLVGRLGGEEFGIFWYDMPEEALNNAAKRVHQTIEALKIRHRPSLAQYVTVSIGAVSVIPTSEGSLIQTLKAADDALYNAKNSGRNRIVLASQ